MSLILAKAFSVSVPRKPDAEFNSISTTRILKCNHKFALNPVDDSLKTLCASQLCSSTNDHLNAMTVRQQQLSVATSREQNQS